MIRVLKSIFWVGILCLVIVFALQNGAELVRPVEIRFDLFVKDLSPGAIPQYGLVLSALLIGLLVGGVWGLIQQLSTRARLRETQRLLRDKEKELDSLRNLPVVDSSSVPAGTYPAQAVGSGNPGEKS